MNKFVRLVPYSHDYECICDHIRRVEVTLYPCNRCGYPVIKDFMCSNCKCMNPNEYNCGYPVIEKLHCLKCNILRKD